MVIKDQKVDVSGRVMRWGKLIGQSAERIIHTSKGDGMCNIFWG